MKTKKGMIPPKMEESPIQLGIWMREVLLHAAQTGHGGQGPGSPEGAGGARG